VICESKSLKLEEAIWIPIQQQNKAAKMPWSAADMDRFLVPLGMAILTAYHLHLWYRVRHHPESTIVGVNHLNRRVWVQNIMTVSSRIFHTTLPPLFVLQSIL
jgi:hypothetical protein